MKKIIYSEAVRLGRRWVKERVRKGLPVILSSPGTPVSYIDLKSTVIRDINLEE